jgi:hypothetical protein
MWTLCVFSKTICIVLNLFTFVTASLTACLKTSAHFCLREGLKEVCGREISPLCIWQGHDWTWGNVQVEALLSGHSGDRRDIEHLRADGKKFLQEGLDKFAAVAESVKRIKEHVQTVQTLEVRC